MVFNGLAFTLMETSICAVGAYVSGFRCLWSSVCVCVCVLNAKLAHSMRNFRIPRPINSIPTSQAQRQCQLGRVPIKPKTSNLPLFPNGFVRHVTHWLHRDVTSDSFDTDITVPIRLARIHLTTKSYSFTPKCNKHLINLRSQQPSRRPQFICWIPFPSDCNPKRWPNPNVSSAIG